VSCLGRVVRELSSAEENKRPSKRLYSINESAEYLGRTPWAVRHLVWKGLPPSVRIGRRTQIDIQDLDALIERHKVTDNA
jgi:hypothetical protein